MAAMVVDEKDSLAKILNYLQGQPKFKVCHLVRTIVLGDLLF